MLPPLRFRPLIKRFRWGGTRLYSVLRKNIGQVVDAAESWEIVDHGTDQSEVVSGEFQGWTLSRLVAEFRGELLGSSLKQTTFPLLVKYLDAHDRLSVQVHPNDEQAERYVSGEQGKTEAWVILEALPGSQIYAGLKPGVDRAALETAVSEGRLSECLHSFEARTGDCVHIPPGTVHAIGEGILLIEIQQSSDITFRLDDWGRLGSDGKPRPLHLQQALECIDFGRGPVNPIVRHSTSEVDLIQNGYFQMRRHRGSHPWSIPADRRFHILNVLEGQARMVCGSNHEHLELGATVLIPAVCTDCVVEPLGSCTLLDTTASQ